MIERQGEVENLARVDRPIQDTVDQIGQAAAHRGGPAMQMNVGVEQLLAV
jgi:hypothetical protein